jgi:hypothetical protein
LTKKIKFFGINILKGCIVKPPCKKEFKIISSKNRFFLTFISVLTLTAFILASCGSPLLRLPQGAEEFVYQVGKGTPYYLYLDGDNNPITEPLGEGDADPGKTALIVQDNPAAEGVMLLAETSPEAYDDVVRIINNNNASTITLYFHKGQTFPWTIGYAVRGRESDGPVFPLRCGPPAILRYVWGGR